MTSQSNCSACKSKSATHHLTQIINNEPQTLDLCADCYTKHAKKQGFPFLNWDPTQKCYFCGEPAQSASMNQEPWKEIRKQLMHYTCHRCFTYENELVLKELAEAPKDLSPREEMDHLKTIALSIDSQVKAKFGK